MSPSSIARFYKKFGIKKKRITFKKKLPRNTEVKKEFILEKIGLDLNELVHQGYKILFLDEVMFTYNTL
jgi:hypothetical protein